MKMKVTKSVKIIAAVAILAAGGVGGWLYLSEEGGGGHAPVPAVAKKAPAKSSPAPGKGAAKVLPTDPDEVIKAVIGVSGTQQFLRDLRQQALESADAIIKGQKGALDLKDMQVAIERTFDPEKMADDLAAGLKQNYDAERMPRFLDLLHQPVSMKMNGLEAQQPAPQAVEHYFAGLKKSPPSLDRQQLIQRVDDTSRASDSAAELVVLMVKYMVQAAQAASPQTATRISRQDLERATESLRGSVGTRFRNMHHFVYRQASDAELGEYVKVLGSDTGKWGTAALNSGIREVVDARGRDLGAALAQLAPAPAAAQAKPAATAQPLGEAKAATVEKKVDADGRKTEAEPVVAEDASKSPPQSVKPKPPTVSVAPDTPLGMVASTNEAEAKHAQAERAESRRAPARQLFTRYNDLLTATIVMDHASMAELLAFGKNPDVRQSNGYTPLMIAASYGDVEAVRLLVAKGANLNQRLPGGETALAMARSRGKAEVAALLESFGAHR
jgi:hypothetical protein